MFPFGSRKQSQEIQNPRNRQNLAPAVVDTGASIVRQPADEYSGPAATAAASAPASVPEPPEDPATALSFPNVTYKGYPVVILYNMGKEDTLDFGQVIERWRALPDDMKFDPLKYAHYVYCYDPESGETLDDVVPPDGFSGDTIKEHDEGVANFMAKLTGKKPEATPAKVDLAEALSGMNKNALRDLFGSMDRDDLFRLFDAARDVKNRIVREEQAAAAAAAEEEAPTEEETPPAEQSQRQQQPARQATQRRQAPPQSGRNRYSGW